MSINKYKLGQKVFRLQENQVVFEAITSIAKGEDWIRYGFRENGQYEDRPVTNWLEEKLFPTKEALLKSL